MKAGSSGNGKSSAQVLVSGPAKIQNNSVRGGGAKKEKKEELSQEMKVLLWSIGKLAAKAEVTTAGDIAKLIDDHKNTLSAISGLNIMSSASVRPNSFISIRFLQFEGRWLFHAHDVFRCKNPGMDDGQQQKLEMALSITGEYALPS